MTDRPKTKTKASPALRKARKELEQANARIEELEKSLQKAVHDLAKRDEMLRAETQKVYQFKQAALDYQKKYDGTHMQLQKLLQRTDEHRYNAQIAQAARDENATRFAEMRDRVFELEHGIEERIAKAEGQAMFYKKKLKEVLMKMREWIDTPVD